MNIDGNESAMALVARESGTIEHGRLLSDREAIGNFDDVSTWAVKGDDTDNLVASVEHLLGSGAIQFDKVDGAGNTAIAGIKDTIAAVNASRFTAGDKLRLAIYVSTIADIASVQIRLGTDASNYNQWTIDDSALVAGWNVVEVDIAAADFIATATSGTGIDWAVITFIEIDVTLDAQDDLLADIRVDHCEIVKA